MKKQIATSNAQAGNPKSATIASGTGRTSPEGASAAACCGCGAAAGLDAARDGIGPGAHAVRVDAGLKAANLKHLNRIEGQVRGIAAMIEEDRYCADIDQVIKAKEAEIMEI